RLTMFPYSTLFRSLLVAIDVADLLVIAERDQIVSVRRVLVARVDREEALGRFDRPRVLLLEIVAEGAHQLRPARPRRIGMLPLDLVEQGSRDPRVARVEPVLCRRIKGFRIARDIAGLAGSSARTEHAAASG